MVGNLGVNNDAILMMEQPTTSFNFYYSIANSINHNDFTGSTWYRQFQANKLCIESPPRITYFKP